jgi:hypothetical protein
MFFIYTILLIDSPVYTHGATSSSYYRDGVTWLNHLRQNISYNAI